MRCLFLRYLVFLGTLFLNSSLKAQPLFISLGSHCEVAVKLRDSHLRTAAYPFDWLLTLNHERFIHLLNNDFQFFLDEKYFLPHPQNPNVIENSYYEIEFRHDGPIYEKIQSKYQRRIARFRQLRDVSKKVFFFRTAYDFQNDPNPYWGNPDQSKITKEQALELKKALDQFFPSLNFLLVIVNYVEENVPPIEGLEGIVEFKVRKYHKEIDYPIIFRSLLRKYYTPQSPLQGQYPSIAYPYR